MRENSAGGKNGGMKKLLILMMALVMTGCTAPVLGLVKKNNANMAKLKTGMATEQVIEVMGPADKTEAYEVKSGGTMMFLFYRTQIDYNFNLQDKHWTPVCIVDGKLKGWGRNYYDDIIKIRKEIIRK